MVLYESETFRHIYMMEYRREIDGLRALAVLPVILFHSGFHLFAGGFVGVDIFFVISGYLITSIILGEMRKGKFSIARFYERRAKRILPVLFVMILVCIPFAWFFMLPHQIKDFSKSLIATATYSSNIYFYLSTDYFNELAELQPLLHTWSLAVEEQYYVVFPLILIVAWRFGEKAILAALVSISVLSFGLATWGAIHWPSAAFYLLPTRAWQLLLGGCSAFLLAGSYPRFLALRQNILASNCFSVVGVVAIFISIFLYSKSTPFPGVYALLPTLGAALIVIFARPYNFVGKVLGHRYFVGVGLISYSAYIWHQPLLSFARLQNITELSVAQSTAICILVLPISYLSWRFIETPARTIELKKVRVFAYTILASCFVAAIGFMGYKTDGFWAQKLAAIDPQFRAQVINREVELAPRMGMWVRVVNSQPREFANAPEKRKVLILGDSKAADLIVSLQVNSHLFPKSSFLQVRLDDECMGLLQRKLEAKGAATNTPVCDEEVNALLQRRVLNDADEIVLSNTWQPHTYKDAANLAKHLAVGGKQVSVISTANFYDLASLSMRVAQLRMNADQTDRYIFENIRQDWNKHSIALRQEIEGVKNIRFLEKLELFCDLAAKKCGLLPVGEKPLVFDSGHVTIHGAYVLGSRIAKSRWFE
jgi:peptidoglycan/LPS O-acetylase OafA/YrhL